jgi:aspartyl-tRNA(Asn)/glutamyl-tRNA(Gln) amidotransferase subunit B
VVFLFSERRAALFLSQRKKESAHDYRYFPEPDIPPFDFSEAYFTALRSTLPELPPAKMRRFVAEYALPEADALVLTEDRDFSEYFEQVTSELAEKRESHEVEGDEKKAWKLAANYLITEVRKHLSDQNKTVKELPFSAENYAEFIGLIIDGKINSSAAQTVLAEMYRGGDNDPSHIVDRLNLSQVSDTGALEGIVDTVLSANEKSVTDYRSGKQNAFQFLIGQIMKETKGKANPQMVSDILQRKLR